MPKKKLFKIPVLRLEKLKLVAQKLAATLGPDNPKVKLMRKEISDREGGRFKLANRPV